LFNRVGLYSTIPLGVNRSGTIGGFHTQPPNQQGGFIRSPDGTITLFALPPGGSVPQPLSFAPYSKFESGGISAQGAVTETYPDQKTLHTAF
jgi:hypothetical protein